jgi:hypothetical protein
MEKNEDTEGIKGRRRKKLLFLLLLLIFFFTSFLIGIFSLIQTPAFINGLGSVLESKLGYKISVQSLSFSSGLQGEISGLTITRMKDGVLSFHSPHVDFEGKISKPLKGEIESITLTQPRLLFRLEKKKKMDLSFLKKLPPVHLLTVQKGVFELSFGSSPQVIRLQEINLQIKDFSPEKGGVINFQGLLRILSSEKGGVEGSGRVNGSVNLISLFPRPSGKGFVEFHLDSGSYHSISFQNLVFKFPINLDKEKVDIDSASLALDSLTHKRDGKDTTLKDFKFQTSFLYDLKSDAINSRIIEGKISNLGTFNGSFSGTLRGDFPWKASLEASSINLAEVFSLFKPLFPTEYQKWFIKGKGSMETHFEGHEISWKGDMIFHFREGEFSSSDGTRAGQGITGKVILKIHSPPSEKKINFELSLKVGEGKFLWGKFYKDLSGEKVTFFSQGSFFLNSPRLLEFQSSLDFLGTGNYSLSGLIQSNESVLSLKAEKISHNKMLSLFKDYLSQNVPSLKSLQLEGDSHLDMRTVIKEGKLSLEGILEIQNTSLKVPDKSFSIDKIDLMLPFDLFYPFLSDTARKERVKESGFLRIGILEKGKERLEGITVPLILSQNNLYITEDINISLFKGKIKLTGFRGEEILSPSRRFHFGLEIEKMDLASLIQNLAEVDLPGILNADFPVISYQDGILFAQGKAVAGIFEGEVEATNLSATGLFSRSRKINGNLSFKGINLEKVSEKIKIGKMTGIIQGSIKNLEIEYGQPSRFILDIESVKTEGVKQKISVDAVQNISILGTGSEGISGVLSSGIKSFFKEYPYSRIGMRCTLENDKFSVRGKIHEGGTEYLVRRAFLRGIDVVNQNPQNVISFKDMQERIRRISRTK